VVAVPAQQTGERKIRVIDPDSPTSDGEIRELAIKQIERRRRFKMRAFSYALIGFIVTLVWAISEYNNAGGWPSDGFSQSSSIPHVWNIWIIYPIIGLVVILAIDAWNTFQQKPISENEVRREIDRIGQLALNGRSLRKRAADNRRT
jgi:2TM domain